MKIQTRPETAEDIDSIRKINAAAFETDAEARLVDDLRDSGIPHISLVAQVDEEVVGHILFSPVTLADKGTDLKIAGLADTALRTGSKCSFTPL